MQRSKPRPEVDIEALAEAYARGLDAERAGDTQQAQAAWRRCLAIDPADRGGAAVRLAAMGLGPDPERASPAYVTTLFNQHAGKFEASLVGRLGYDIPRIMAEALAETRPDGFAHGVDLGCGTGLQGAALHGQVTRLDGLDLARKMLQIASEKGVYDELYVGDVTVFLRKAAPGTYDLAVASDVFPYLGAVDAFFTAAASALRPGGLLAFSTETLPPEAFDGRLWRVGPHRRFAHEPSALRQSLSEAGFTTRRADPVIIRSEKRVPVQGHLVIAELEA
ncbi:MAG: methyltransferase domain-containing protein [Pseudomonadota bacterium]